MVLAEGRLEVVGGLGKEQEAARASKFEVGVAKEPATRKTTDVRAKSICMLLIYERPVRMIQSG